MGARAVETVCNRAASAIGRPATDSLLTSKQRSVTVVGRQLEAAGRARVVPLEPWQNALPAATAPLADRPTDRPPQHSGTVLYE